MTYASISSVASYFAERPAFLERKFMMGSNRSIEKGLIFGFSYVLCGNYLNSFIKVAFLGKGSSGWTG